jgi:hypothetical protein
MDISLITTLWLFSLFTCLCEATAHYHIQSMTWGQSFTWSHKIHDENYHIFYALVWGLLMFTLILIDVDLWPFAVTHLVMRRTAFSWYLNHLHSFENAPGRKFYHLSDNGADGFFKKVFGEGGFAWISFILLITSILAMYKFLSKTPS